MSSKVRPISPIAQLEEGEFHWIGTPPPTYKEAMDYAVDGEWLVLLFSGQAYNLSIVKKETYPYKDLKEESPLLAYFSLIRVTRSGMKKLFPKKY